MKTFVVEVWSRIFNFLSFISPFKLIRIIFPKLKKDYGFVDLYVLCNLIFSFICLSVLSPLMPQWLKIVILSYAGIRVFEIIIYQANVLLFDQYRKKDYAIKSYIRLILLLLHNYIEILFWFALFYRNLSFLFDSKDILLDSLGGSLYFSIMSITLFGANEIVFKETGGMFLLSIEVLIGIFMTLLIISRFISLIPNPKSLDKL